MKSFTMKRTEGNNILKIIRHDAFLITIATLIVFLVWNFEAVKRFTYYLFH